MLDPSTLCALREELSGIELISEPAKVARLSRDFAWFSPILKAALADKRADLVLTPGDESELLRVLAACYRHRLPVTVRGKGTGNYGQCTPLHGGALVDLNRMNQICWIKDGVARVQAGALMSDIDLAARREGWELRMLPSTYRMSTAAGFYCGGFGGIGSITWGTIGDIGNVVGVRALSLEAQPQAIELRDAQARDLYHAYGVNGVISELEFALAPLQDWQELLLSFSDFMSAVQFARTIGNAGGIAKKLLSVLASPLPQLCGLEDRVQADRTAVVCIVSRPALEAVAGVAQEQGGRIELTQEHALVYGTRESLMERTWNHTTLHTLSGNKDVTYLECIYATNDYVAQVEQMARHFGDEVMMHLEFILAGGALTCVGIPVVRYTGEARLNEIIRFHQSHGVHVNGSHSYMLEDGGKLTSESRSLAMKRRLDPAGLLNPGKTRAESLAA
jgi:FAD/FMN-containing dehydrogenase